MFAPKQQKNSGHHPSNDNQKKIPFVLQRQGLNKGIHEKLKIGRKDDAFEKEADSVADQVVSKSETPNVEAASAPPIQTMKVGPGDLAQRESDVQLQEEEEVQLQSELESESDVQMMEEDSSTTEMGTDESESVQLKSEPEVQTKSDTDTPRTSSGDSMSTLSGVEMSTPQATPAPPVQLQAESSSDEELQMKEDEESTEEADTVQMKSKSVDSGDDVSSQIQSAKGGGMPMEDSIKSEMESGFGHDFSNVRIHTGSGASNMNKSLGAKAFTTGNDIFFNEGEYQPNAKSGKQLLAHELTHTLQQGKAETNVQLKEKPEKRGRDFIQFGKQLIRNLKRSGASNSELVNMHFLLERYKMEFKNPTKAVNWELAGGLSEFKRQVVSPSVQEQIDNELSSLFDKFPEYKDDLIEFTNWDDIELTPLRTLEVKTILPESRKVEELRPSSLLPEYGTDIEIDEPLNMAQIVRYRWFDVLADFKKENSGIEDEYLLPFARKHLKMGWTYGNTKVPNIRDITITTVTKYWGKKAFNVKYVTAFNYDDAYAATEGQDYFWYRISPITGEVKTGIQRHGSVSRYNNNTFGHLDKDGKTALLNSLNKIAKNDALLEEVKKEVEVGFGMQFAELVKEVQRSFYGDDPNLVTGMLNPWTLEKLNHKVETIAVNATTSGNDPRMILINKLYYVTGNYSLYYNAVVEELKNSTVSSEPHDCSYEHFSELVQFAQLVLFGTTQGHKEYGDSETFEAVDQWGKRFGGNINSSDEYRVKLMTEREYYANDQIRESLENQLASVNLKIKVRHEKNKSWGHDGFWELMEEQQLLRTKLYYVSYAYILSKYNNLRIWHIENEFHDSGGKVPTGLQFYPIENPFGSTTEFDYSDSPAPLISNRVENLDREKKVSDFYKNFAESPQSSLDQQIQDLENYIAVTTYKVAIENNVIGKSKTAAFKSLIESYVSTDNILDTSKDEYGNLRDPDPMGLDKYYPDTGIEKIKLETDILPLSASTELRYIVKGLAQRLEAIPDKDSEVYYFYTGLINLFNIYLEGSDFITAPTLHSKYGGRYSDDDLVKIASELVGRDIVRYGREHGNLESDELHGAMERKAFLEEKRDAYGGKTRTVPAYLILDQSRVSAGPSISRYRSKSSLPNNYQRLVDEGIPLNVFYRFSGGRHTVFVQLDESKTIRESRQGNKDENEDEVIKELLSNIEEDNKLPPGRFYFIQTTKLWYSFQTRTDHWTWEEVVRAISIGLAIVSIPFTLGGSSGIAGILMASSLATGILAEGMHIHNSMRDGTLTTGDLGASLLNILASALLKVQVLRGIPKIAGMSGNLATLNGQRFAQLSRVVNAADAVVQGYTIAESTYEELKNVPDDLPEHERRRAIMNILLKGLALGYITFKSLKSDLKDYSKFSRYERQLLKEGGFESIFPSLADPTVPIKAPDSTPALTLGKKQPDLIEAPVYLVPQGEDFKMIDYSISQDGVTVYLTREEFVRRLNSGEVDLNKAQVKTNDNFSPEVLVALRKVEAKLKIDDLGVSSAIFENKILQSRYNELLSEVPENLHSKVNSITRGAANNTVNSELIVDLFAGSERSSILGLVRRFGLSSDPKLFDNLLNYVAKHQGNEIQLSMVISYLDGINEIGILRSVLSENVGLNYVFRGTSKDFGGKGNKVAGRTSTSVDPVVSTIFGLNAEYMSGRGVIKIINSKELLNVELGYPNVLSKSEMEVAFDMSPTELSDIKLIEVPIEKARLALKEMGIELPSSYSVKTAEDVANLIANSRKLTPAEIKSFVEKISN